MPIVLLCAVAMVLYALFGVATAQASLKLNSFLVAAISAAMGVAIPLVAYYTVSAKKNLPVSVDGVVLSLVAGALIASFSMLFIYIFSKAENVSFVMPVIFGGTIVVSSLIGIIFFKEQTSLIGAVGLLVITLGVGLVVYSRLNFA